MDEKNNKKIEKKEEQQPQNKTRRGRKPKREASDEQTKNVKEETKASEEEKTPTLETSLLLLKEIGYKRVSNKTFINENDLNAFLNQDFSNINKTKAFGFIKILEREYPVDLSELKAAYIEYHRGHKRKEKESSFVHAVQTDEKNWKKYLLWGVASLVGASLLWFLLSQSRSDSKESVVNSQTISPDINSNIVKKATQNISALDQNDTKEKAEDENVLRFDESVKEEPKQSKAQETNKSDSVKIGLEDDLDLDTMVKQMIKENNITIAAQTQEQNSVEDNSTKEKTLQTSSEKVKEEKKVLAQPVKKEIKEKKISKPKHQVKPKTKVSKIDFAKQKAILKSKLYIQPLKKTWVGVIYLDDYTKKDFLVKSVFKLNSTRPQLIVVGHKYFEIYNQGYSYRFRGNGPIRFIYKDGDIMQINRNEFLTYSKGVNW